MVAGMDCSKEGVNFLLDDESMEGRKEIGQAQTEMIARLKPGATCAPAMAGFTASFAGRNANRSLKD